MISSNFLTTHHQRAQGSILIGNFAAFFAADFHSHSTGTIVTKNQALSKPVLSVATRLTLRL
jgi:hypothetical protein